MTTIYVVLPYTTNYKSTLTSAILTFTSQEEAYDYASEFKFVEVITTILFNNVTGGAQIKQITI